MMSRFPLIFTIIALLATYVSAHNHILPSWGKACFYEDVKKGDQLAVTFQIGNRDAYSSEQPIADFWVSIDYFIGIYIFLIMIARF